MARKKEYQEDLVLEKAMHTFWANGFENTSLRILEKDMGINQFSIYSSFGSKQGLFIEVLKKHKGFVKEFFY
jgi:AcrR family transcriptional regulator